jgi:lipoprotein-releasing system ATP-binding protein
MDAAIIQAENLEKIYGQGRNALRVLKGVTMHVRRGEILSIMGPSGAGKSTLLNLIGCLDSFQSGTLVVDGMDVSHLSVEALSDFRNRHIGFVFQLHNLLPEFTALENVVIPLLIRRISMRRAKDAAMEIIEKFGLSDRAHHKPAELSGGECQRIAVARAIVGNPHIILADEPTGSLDSENSKSLIEALFALGREHNTTIVIVTHSKEIASMTERIITLVDGELKSDAKNGTDF